MQWFALINLIACCLLLLVAAYTGQRADRKKHLSFIVLLLVMAIYSLGLAFESLSTSLGSAWFWSRVQYLVFPLLPSLILLVILRFSDVAIKASPVSWLMLGCFSFSLLVTVLHWSSPWHSLYYQNIQLSDVGGVYFLSFSPGIFYHLFDIFYVSISVVSMVLLARRIVMHRGVFRVQAVVIMLGLAFPLAFFLIKGFIPLPNELDLIPISFVPTALILAYGLLSRGLMDISPIAMRTVFRSMPSGCIIVDHKRRLLEYNEAAVKMFAGLDRADPGQPIQTIYQSFPGFGDVLDALVERDQWQIWSPDYRVHYRVQLTWLEQQETHLGYMILIQDITQQINAEKLLRERAELDGLTGVLNRASFDEHLRQQLQEQHEAGASLALILFDLDHFKVLNDTEGHQAGDEVLKMIARVAIELVRQGDIIARYGGEEFAIILPKTDMTGAWVIAERLRLAIETNTRVTASVGISIADASQPLSSAELIQRADQALYQAKNEGRNLVKVASGQPAKDPNPGN